MSHDLETIEGKVSAAFVVTGEGERQIPWHRLGTYVGAAMTAEEALRLARMDWEVRLVPLVLGGDDAGVEVADRQAVVRDHPITERPEILGVVGMTWTPVQNRQAFRFCDDLVQAAGDAHYETAGILRPQGKALGSQTFMTIQRPDLILDPKGRADRIGNYLLCANGFDGRRAFTIKDTKVRVVCRNTQEAALSGTGREWKVRHSARIEGRLDEAREALGMLTNYGEEFAAAATAMIQREVSRGEVHRYFTRVFPEPAGDASNLLVERYANRMLALDSLYTGPNNATITGTTWGAYQAVTEYVDWFRPTRGARATQATQTLTSSRVIGVKERAFALAAAI